MSILLSWLLGGAAWAGPLDFDLGAGFSRDVVDDWEVVVTTDQGETESRRGVVHSRWQWAEQQDGTWHLFRVPGEPLHVLPPDEGLAVALGERMAAPFDVVLQPDGSVALSGSTPWRDEAGAPDLPALLQPSWAATVGRVLVGLDGVDPEAADAAETGGNTWRRAIVVEQDCPEVGQRCVVATWARLLEGAPEAGPLPVGGLREQERWWLSVDGLRPLRMTRTVEASWQPRRARQAWTATMTVQRYVLPPEPTPPSR